MRTDSSGIGISAALLLGACILLNPLIPQKANTVDFRAISIPMTIHSSQFSLALAAIEDDRMNLDQQIPEQFHPTQVIQLEQDNRPFDFSRLVPQRTPVEWVTSQPIKPASIKPTPTKARVLLLTPMHLSKNDVNVAKLLPVRPAQIVIAAAAAATAPAPTPTIRVAPPSKRQPENVNEVAEQLVQEELIRRAEHPQWLQATQITAPRTPAIESGSATTKVLPGPVYVSTALPPRAAKTPARPASTPAFHAAASPTPATRPDPATFVAAHSPQRQPAMLGALEPIQAPAVTLHGTIELADGLAFTGANQQIVVRHSLAGVLAEEGQVNLESGTYNIEVANPTGSVVAQLVDASGQVIGTGEVPLRKFSNGAASIRLTPVVYGIAGQVISAYSFGNTIKPVPGALVSLDTAGLEMQTVQDGTFEDPTIALGSSFVVRAQDSGYWGTLAVGKSGESMSIPLLPNTMVKALLDLSLDENHRAAADQNGVIWGEVTRGGQPVSGAQVEIADATLKPIYFNSFSQFFLPDTTLTSTSSNGLFAIANVPPGLQMVRVKIGNDALYAQVIPVDRHFVSHLAFEIKAQQTPELTVTDALNFQERVDANVRWAGSTQVTPFARAQTDPQIPLWNGSGLTFLESDAGAAYALTRQSFNDAAPLIHATPVPNEWLNQLSLQARVNVDPSLATVVIQATGSTFEAYLSRQVDYDLANRVYTTADGRPISSQYCPANGMAVFFNVPPGLQTFFLHQPGSPRYVTSLVDAGPTAVNVVNHGF